ncbi:MAG: 2-oxoacid:acceptor oxidoreductase subunit alpha [Candidatus Aenigmatarchaeota archaeon]
MAERINDFVWLLGGEAGYGILTAGEIFARACMYAGLNVFTNSEYPSLIRGGHNTFMVRVSQGEVNAHARNADVLVALNKETVELHAGELNKGASIVFDPAACGEITAAKLCPVPFSRILSDLGAERIVANSIALGASAALLELDFCFLEDSMEKVFGRKEKEVRQNIVAAQAGYSYVKATFPDKPAVGIAPLPRKPRILVSGNDALALGAIAAGCRFAAIYPMTPITQILHRLAKWQRDFGIVVMQPEDEIAGINAAIGASFAGVRSLVATSGGGFSLMAEALGMAGMTETPLVVIWGQRGGPSTGLPTHTAQSDLQFALRASQGEFPRAVLAPGDAEECFYAVAEAFNIAERWQTPVIILVDKHVCECFKSVEPLETKDITIDRGLLVSKESFTTPEKPFPRYKITDSGVSQRVLPGHNIIFRAVADEHDEFGYLTEEPAVCAAMQAKRLRKLGGMAKEIPEPKLCGPDEADITIIGWGSTKGPILDALPILKARGIVANSLHIYAVWPFPVGALNRILDKAKRVVCIEQNATGQMASLIREQTGKTVESLLKYDGRQWTPEQVAEAAIRCIKGES